MSYGVVSAMTKLPYPPGFYQAGVYAFLIYNCFQLYEDTFQEVEKSWGLSKAAVTQLGLRSCPSLTLNLIAGAECLSRFGRDVLAETPGFYAYTREGMICDCHEWRDDCACALESWRMDLDPKLADRGVIVPVPHKKYGWIDSLSVFRNVRDPRPFTLRVRTEAAA